MLCILKLILFYLPIYILWIQLTVFILNFLLLLKYTETHGEKIRKYSYKIPL